MATGRDEGSMSSVLEEIVDACHAQKNWTGKIMVSLASIPATPPSPKPCLRGSSLPIK